MIHLAILKPGYIKAILAGTKTIESRLTKTAQPPYGKVESGERLFLKASGGPFMATAIASCVESHEDLTPSDVARLRKRFANTVGGAREYWQSKRESRFATFITLSEAEPIAVGPVYKPAHMKAWYVLDERLSPLRDWTITAGALRNRYACLPLPKGTEIKPGKPITLVLPSGETVRTDLARGRMLRWRGWGPVYDSAGAQPNDVLRFVAVGPGRYTVRVTSRQH